MASRGVGCVCPESRPLIMGTEVGGVGRVAGCDVCSDASQDKQLASRVDYAFMD